MRRHINGVTRFASKGPVLNLCSVSYPTPCALLSMVISTRVFSVLHTVYMCMLVLASGVLKVVSISISISCVEMH